jgi:hypothetical protein
VECSQGAQRGTFAHQILHKDEKKSLTADAALFRIWYSARVKDELPANRKYAGLCADCIHARQVASDRGSVFFMCELALVDARFQKYPRLPVLVCPGYAPPAPDTVKKQ